MTTAGATPCEVGRAQRRDPPVGAIGRPPRRCSSRRTTACRARRRAGSPCRWPRTTPCRSRSRRRDTRAPAARAPGRPRRAAQQRAHRGEVAARAVAHRPRAASRRRRTSAAFVDRPRERPPAVVERRRERMLGREPVVDRHHDRARRVRDLARDEVVLLDAADRPAAAVEVHDDRQVGIGRRPVHAHRNAVGVDDPRPRTPARVRPPRHRDEHAATVARSLAAARRSAAISRASRSSRSQKACACGCSGTSGRPERARAARATDDVPRLLAGRQELVHPEEAVEQTVGAHDLGRHVRVAQPSLPYASP